MFFWQLLFVFLFAFHSLQGCAYRYHLPILKHAGYPHKRTSRATSPPIRFHCTYATPDVDRPHSEKTESRRRSSPVVIQSPVRPIFLTEVPDPLPRHGRRSSGQTSASQGQRQSPTSSVASTKGGEEEGGENEPGGSERAGDGSSVATESLSDTPLSQQSEIPSYSGGSSLTVTPSPTPEIEQESETSYLTVTPSPTPEIEQESETSYLTVTPSPTPEIEHESETADVQPGEPAATSHEGWSSASRVPVVGDNDDMSCTVDSLSTEETDISLSPSSHSTGEECPISPEDLTGSEISQGKEAEESVSASESSTVQAEHAFDLTGSEIIQGKEAEEKVSASRSSPTQAERTSDDQQPCLEKSRASSGSAHASMKTDTSRSRDTKETSLGSSTATVEQVERERASFDPSPTHSLESAMTEETTLSGDPSRPPSQAVDGDEKRTLSPDSIASSRSSIGPVVLTEDEDASSDDTIKARRRAAEAHGGKETLTGELRSEERRTDVQAEGGKRTPSGDREDQAAQEQDAEHSGEGQPHRLEACDHDPVASASHGSEFTELKQSGDTSTGQAEYTPFQDVADPTYDPIFFWIPNSELEREEAVALQTRFLLSRTPAVDMLWKHRDVICWSKAPLERTTSG